MIERIKRFQKILSTREKVRNEERLLLSEKRNYEQNIVSLMNGLQEEKQQALHVFSTQDNCLFSPQDMWYRRKSIDCIERKLDEAHEALLQIQYAIRQSEERLLQKHKDVKVMETYLGKMKDEYNQVVSRMEQEELDDIATIRFENKSGE
ncbi:MAG: flagellar FliJ family protein [Aminobacterium sp.]|jgi:flagellar FliJ protein|uniref:flagellar export protein FliJ n=1 Tax=Aminobacterium sp. TaxID=1872491 RepID=UPI001BCD51CF|nr:flagellar FliJ family protein [Aminobacterium sp.]MDD2207066.1 flagellar FliJ family protein [Aminobacterium sp.]MDD3425594.1 flagellar FliJ family protein [Aminobacterium sp.]MDD3707427.1 flagellar FliJ family protein [Aminobacterium sp.]MDD4228769.1 flagellar FliJ family protein [Aminobacterium sp.]MDD4550612.1 flagellar FliJ family protein [Aminobacterium sp.]